MGGGGNFYTRIIPLYLDPGLGTDEITKNGETELIKYLIHLLLLVLSSSLLIESAVP